MNAALPALQVPELAEVPLPPWPEHDPLLRAMWQRYVAGEIELEAIAAALPGRTVKAIKVRASRLELPRRTFRRVQKQNAEPSPAPEDSGTSPPAPVAAPRRSSQSEYAGDTRCLFQGPTCLGTFYSPDRRKIRTCPACKESKEYAGASSLPTGSLRLP